MSPPPPPPPHPQWYPLLTNPTTNEPYLRLPPPHSHIILTPYRPSDPPSIPPIHNDPRVYPYLLGPLHPYLQEHADAWVTENIAVSNSILHDLSSTPAPAPAPVSEVNEDDDDKNELDSTKSDSLKTVDVCPVRVIREQNPEDPSDTGIFIGDCTLQRSHFLEVVDKAERARLVEENNDKEIGDPEIVWSFGDYLAPSHHGQGIMTSVIHTLITSWAIPRMNVHHIRLTVFANNTGSLRVFEKNGFSLIDTVQDCFEIAESKGGGRRGAWVVEWRREKTAAEG